MQTENHRPLRYRRGLSGKSYPAIYSNYDSLRRLYVHYYCGGTRRAYLRSCSRMGRAGISAHWDFRKRAIAKITFYISSYILIIRKPRVYQLTVITAEDIPRYDIVSTAVSWRVEFIGPLVNARYTSEEVSRDDVVYIKREIAS